MPKPKTFHIKPLKLFFIMTQSISTHKKSYRTPKYDALLAVYSMKSIVMTDVILQHENLIMRKHSISISWS